MNFEKISANTLNLLTKVKNNLENSRNRRQILIDSMAKKENKGMDCKSCIGHCCTFEHNSMMPTAIEALELLGYLVKEKRLDQELINSLNNNKNSYRLDKDYVHGTNKQIRKFYTCPFFNSGSLGCSISRGAKPYGCLAFNPNEALVKKPGHCSSQKRLLEKRDQLFFEQEEQVNNYLTKELGIFWQKRNISMALLDLINLLGKN
ncbi:MAG: hypothetical protein N4A33_03805 [Bacteriovoracaceae bacterium]|jgi:Fe-S-cluster containining protein|nr:hypothetical protein [Bacteriovoracaceae bacterium]